MKNHETCNAPKCLKSSVFIDWINCTLCNGWVHIKCANLLRTEARSLAESKCSRCSLVKTIPQCQDDNFEFYPPKTYHHTQLPNLLVEKNFANLLQYFLDFQSFFLDTSVVEKLVF